MQFVKVKIEDVATKETKTGFTSIYKDIYAGLEGFITEAFKPESEITAKDENGNLQYYKIISVPRSITEAKNPVDSIGANIRAYFKRNDKKPAIRFVVQYAKTKEGKEDKTNIDIFARKMETSEPNDEPKETETKTEETETDKTLPDAETIASAVEDSPL